MTAPVVSVMEQAAPNMAKAGAASPGIVALWLSGVLVLVTPRAMGRLWVRSSIARPVVVAAINLPLAAAWIFSSVVCAHIWSTLSDTAWNARNDSAQTSLLASFSTHMQSVYTLLTNQWNLLLATDRVAAVAFGFFFLVAALLVPFFILLPFGAKPSGNGACVRHVARCILLGTGILHVWGIAFCGLFLWFTRYNPLGDYEKALSPALLLFSILMLWTLTALIRAARCDYRSPADYPAAHDPWCDDCGYDLVAADPAGRCPECGRLVGDSVGAHTRPPTAWESHPSPRNLAAIVGQLKQLIGHPRQLFFAMPTLTGQAAAQRWLLGSMVAVGLFAALSVPCIAVINHGFEWSMSLFTGGLAMGLVWALMGMMMVGIETAGIATFSRMRSQNAASGGGRGVYLAAAAKVTAYSSPLMLFWVFLGGLQLLGYLYWDANHMSMLLHVSLRTEQILLAISLSAAHIGGLLWYELTVYRGIRAIQFANK